MPTPPTSETIPAWTITTHALDGTIPMRLTRHPGQPIKLEGDIAFLQAILAELAFLLPPQPN